MSFILWSEQLNVGIDSIDAEHRQLIAIVNDLHRALAEGRDQVAVGVALERLLHYTRSHFAHEEALLAECGYPDLEAHKQEHDAMVQWAVKKQEEVRTGHGAEISAEVLESLKDWFFDHLGRADQSYVPHLQAAGRL